MHKSLHTDIHLEITKGRLECQRIHRALHMKLESHPCAFGGLNGRSEYLNITIEPFGLQMEEIKLCEDLAAYPRVTATPVPPDESQCQRPRYKASAQ
jgi:hypothetical protein